MTAISKAEFVCAIYCIRMHGCIYARILTLGRAASSFRPVFLKNLSLNAVILERLQHGRPDYAAISKARDAPRNV